MESTEGSTWEGESEGSPTLIPEIACHGQNVHGRCHTYKGHSFGPYNPEQIILKEPFKCHIGSGAEQVELTFF